MEETLTEEQVVRVLGHGTFGEALLVRRGNEYLVLKKVSMGSMAPGLRMYQLQEATLLRDLDHPNVVMYRGQNFRGDTLHLYMEFCEGGDLLAAISTQELTNQHFTENTIKDWMRQLASALQYIHAARILHRDLKPNNIFLSSDKKNVKLGDFGLARVLSEGSQIAATTLGTPGYWAPEVYTGGQYDSKADMYSFGASIFHAAALTRPQPEKEVPTIYSVELRHLIVALLSLSPQNRPSAVKVLADPALASPASSNTQISIIIRGIDGAKSRLRVSPTSTVRQVKLTFQQRQGIDPSTVSLSFNGVTLADHQTLTHYGISDGNNLQFILKYVGGGGGEGTRGRGSYS